MEKQNSTIEMRPPVTEVGVLGWLKKNLFSTWYNILLTVILRLFSCIINCF